MAHIAGWQDITPEKYILIWLGLIGNCVSLEVPWEPFADKISQDRRIRTF